MKYRLICDIILLEGKVNKNYFENYKPKFSDGILREHNIPVYEKIIKGLSKRNKVLFEQATGTGKTYLALKFLHDHAKGKKVLFVSPSDSIDMYFIDALVCTLLDLEEEKIIGISKKQKIELIKEFLDIDFRSCLYQGLKGVQDNKYDIIIFDEAHRMGAKTWGPNAEKLINNNPDANIIGMTATMDRTDGEDIKKFFDGKSPVSRMTLVDALKKGILPSFDYKLGKISFEEESKFVEDSIKDFYEKLKTAEGEERKEILEFLDKLKQAKKSISGSKEIPTIFKESINTEELKKGKFIVFCPPGQDLDEDNESIHRMQAIMKQAPSWFSQVQGLKGIRTYSVYSQEGVSKNRQTIKEFESDDSDSLKLLFSINMLNEGLHVDDIDGVIMLRSTSSRIIYLQQLGRALSVGHNQNPKIFDFVANLSYVDVQEITGIAKSVNGGSQPDGNIANFDGEVDIREKEIFNLKIENLEELQFIEKLKSNIYSFNHKNDFEFEDFYQRLIKYKEEFGDCKVLVRYKTEDGYALGMKVASIRQDNINLSKEQKELLNKLGFIWDAKNIFDFEGFYKRLVEYKNEFGDCKVPVFYKCKDNYKLGDKIKNIRKGDIRLSDDQKEQLNELGFVWKVIKFDFQDFYDRLVQYKEEYCDLNVSTKFICEDGYKLGQKISSIRSGLIILSEKQKELLNNLGFMWNNKRVFDFEGFYERLVQYKEKFGDCKISLLYQCEDGYKIGKKVNSIRIGDVKLSDTQKELLNKLGFIWDAKNIFDFESFYERLVQYKAKFGDCKVVYNYTSEDGYKLGAKVHSIRKREIKLSEIQLSKLNEIGFVWKIIRFDFEDFYKRLVEYKKQFGDCKVVQSYECEDGYKLGQKVRSIRKGKIKLSKDQEKQLNEIGFMWSVAKKYKNDDLDEIESNI